MQTFNIKSTTVQAELVTAENIDSVAVWCNGSVKGVQLDASQRCIDFWSMGVEFRAEVGDYVTMSEQGIFVAKTADQMAIQYNPPGTDQQLVSAAVMREAVQRWQGLAMMFMWRMVGDNPMVLAKDTIDAFQSRFETDTPGLEAIEVEDGIQFRLVNAQGVAQVPDAANDPS